MKKYYSATLGANTDTTYNSRGMAFEARAGPGPHLLRHHATMTPRKRQTHGTCPGLGQNQL